MSQNELMLRGIEIKLDRLLDLFQIREEKKENETKTQDVQGEWITLTQACRMHGGYTLSTLRARLDLQPKMGLGVQIGHNKCWRREEVIEWLNAVTPEQRKAYKKKYEQENAM